jgi:hypothetical protein
VGDHFQKMKGKATDGLTYRKQAAAYRGAQPAAGRAVTLRLEIEDGWKIG